MLHSLNFNKGYLHSVIRSAMASYTPAAFNDNPVSFLARLDWKPMSYGWYVAKFTTERCDHCIGLIFMCAVGEDKDIRVEGYLHVTDVRYLDERIYVMHNNGTTRVFSALPTRICIGSW